MRSLRAAFRFLTRLPIPGPESTWQDTARGMGHFPLVGAFVGLLISGAFVLGTCLWSPMVAAVLAIALGLMVTGGFHEDGASDAADGLGGGWTKERTLEIMKDSRIGAYGAMTLWCLLMFRFAALLNLGDRSIFIFPAAMALGRWSISFFMKSLSPLSKGLASEIHAHRCPWAYPLATLWAALAVLGLLYFKMPHVLWGVAAAAVMTLLWTFYLKKRMGGHSGDLLGAGSQIVECAALLAWMVS